MQLPIIAILSVREREMQFYSEIINIYYIYILHEILFYFICVLVSSHELLCSNQQNCPDGCNCWTNEMKTNTMRFECDESVANFTQFLVQLNSVLQTIEPQEYHIKLSNLLDNERAPHFLNGMFPSLHIFVLWFTSRLLD